MKSIKLLAALSAVCLVALGAMSCQKDKGSTVPALDPVSFSGEIASEDAVDLGLSVCWAGCNVGAEAPEQLGDFFVWGVPEAKEAADSCDIEHWPYYDVETKNRLKYNNDDGLAVLAAADDPATAVLGAGFRTPTAAEITELVKGCDWTYVTYKGVTGWVATKKAPEAPADPDPGVGGGEAAAPASRGELAEELPSIFFPVSGYQVHDLKRGTDRGVYLSATLISKNGEAINTLSFNNREASLGSLTLYYGAQVRAVSAPAE